MNSISTFRLHQSHFQNLVIINKNQRIGFMEGSDRIKDGF
ncbi:hypothetical protein LEP1GSC151_0034 [Leptospira interrogans serovar Grippotyphosa str. LT2186]|uniref:Uncharacterized protein n=1 Tax=Leptospira interrogans serovar Grippotyphosa str. LT2186 TaxID=1001599 RepID=M3IA97_LEPIR|nr:hypothetical protein LEP1GSC151_0034 [Leptospira interrogans serovar Grippotyphosa str. LT2186]